MLKPSVPITTLRARPLRRCAELAWGSAQGRQIGSHRRGWTARQGAHARVPSDASLPRGSLRARCAGVLTLSISNT